MCEKNTRVITICECLIAMCLVAGVSMSSYMVGTMAQGQDACVYIDDKLHDAILDALPHD